MGVPGEVVIHVFLDFIYRLDFKKKFVELNANTAISKKVVLRKFKIYKIQNTINSIRSTNSAITSAGCVKKGNRTLQRSM